MRLRCSKVFLNKYFFINMTTVYYTICFATFFITVVKSLANCPPGCKCDDNTLVVQCGEGQLDVLPIALNPSIQRLVIKSNKIKTIDSSIQFYAELMFLDLSFNHISAIPQKTFIYQKKLKELYMNHNKIGQINNKTLLGLSALTHLNLRGNLISKLYEDTFLSLVKLEILNLGENRIAHINIKAFDGLTSLRALYLDNNALTFVPDAMLFKAINGLAELYLDKNILTNLPANSFSYLENLKILSLKGTGLRNITKDSFKGLRSLIALDLSDNRFAHIPTVAFTHLKTLEELFLGENEFEIVAENAFDGMKNLKHLDISNTFHLKKIKNLAFSTNTNLEYLNVSSNKMFNEIQIGTLNELINLRHIVFKANAFSTFPEELFPQENLAFLDLSENPIVCDCRLMWLRNLLIGNRFNDSIADITCEFPERLRGESLKNINPTLIGCSYADSHKQALIGTLLACCVAIITALFLIAYRSRKSLRLYLKNDSCDRSPTEKKQHEYRKGFNDENYILQQQNQSSYTIETISTYANDYTLQQNLANNLIHPKRNTFSFEPHLMQVSNTTLSKKKAIESASENINRCSFVMKQGLDDPSSIYLLKQPNVLTSTALINDPSSIYTEIPAMQPDIAPSRQQNHHHNFVRDDCNHQFFRSDLLHNCVDIVDPNYTYSKVHYSLSNDQPFCPSISSLPLCNALQNPNKLQTSNTYNKTHINH